jgi:hypothetical protein
MEHDMITLTELEAIARKINNLPRPLDIQASPLDLTVKERRIVTAVGVVNRLASFNDFKRLNDKIKNHHHVTLNVTDGIEFREKVKRVSPVGSDDALKLEQV